MTRTARAICLFGIFFSLLTISLPAAPLLATEAGQPDRVAFLPFEVHAATDLSYLKEGIRDMLASRLAANAGIVVVDRKTLRQAGAVADDRRRVDVLRDLGQQLGADYVITGSLTFLGGGMSLDAGVLSMAAGDALSHYYATAATEKDVIMAIDQLALDIAVKTFKATPPAAAARPAPASSVPATPPFQTMHPDKAFAMTPAGATTTSPLVRPKAITDPRGFTKTKNFDLHMQAMDVGDVDGDGVDEIIVATTNEVVVFHRQGRQFSELGRTRLPIHGRVHAISAADLNMNGRVEIYVSAADNSYPNSCGLEWQGNAFTTLFRNADWYIKALTMPGQGMILAGQRSGATEPMRPGIFRLERQGKVLQAEEKLALPDFINLFDFAMADLDGDGAAELIAINQSDRLFVLRSNGSLAWQSQEYYGGTSRYIGEETALQRSGLDINSADANETDGLEDNPGRIYIPSRIVITDINNDNLADVVISRNLSKVARITKDLKNFRNGEIHGLTWNGIGLTEVWHTRKIDGYIADYQMRADDADQPDKKTLYVGIVLQGGWLDLLSSAESTVLLYDLNFGGEQQ